MSKESDPLPLPDDDVCHVSVVKELLFSGSSSDWLDKLSTEPQLIPLSSSLNRGRNQPPFQGGLDWNTELT